MDTELERARRGGGRRPSCDRPPPEPRAGRRVDEGHLARSLGVPASLTERILTQLAKSGMVQRLDGSNEIEYTVATDAY